MKGQSDLMLALEQLEREKGIKKEEILKTVSDALVSALRKYFGKTAQIVAGIDPESGEMMGFLVKKIVEDVNSSELEISFEEAQKRYIKALGKGLKKVMSKMGISTYHSYCGAQIFDIVGLSSTFVDKYFTGTATTVEGTGLKGIALEAMEEAIMLFVR